MYKLVIIEDTVRVTPDRFSEELNGVILDIVRKNYGGITDKDLGTILAIAKILETSTGKIITGDGASFHDVKFEALIYRPEVNEIALGEIVEIVEFGGFIRLGPLDGLVHVSQVMNDFVGYDKKKGTLYGKESKHSLKEGDKVRARIVTVSLNRGGKAGGKVGLTMRQPGLGKLEWINESKKGDKS